MHSTRNVEIEGMSCESCVTSITTHLLNIRGLEEVEISLEDSVAYIKCDEEINDLEINKAIVNAGFSVLGSKDINNAFWNDKKTWLTSANNTKWCLIGCSIGEFGTLAYYTYSGVTEGLEKWSAIWLFYLLLPLINGLITSIMLETAILIRDQMDFKNALSTALGMSFISLLMMEIAMLITDLLFTKGEVGLMPIAIPFMLIVGFLTPWPYNYWRLKKYGMACH